MDDLKNQKCRILVAHSTGLQRTNEQSKVIGERAIISIQAMTGETDWVEFRKALRTTAALRRVAAAT